jgi:hypothetical protein
LFLLCPGPSLSAGGGGHFVVLALYSSKKSCCVCRLLMNGFAF